ncbi:hypothetical protein HanXRQr2_Chr02g0046441 [Helianthus annuus]|uniref:Uncharacterized protein n=1 Tax=Helianthus annuus TaxID=4232 RepID=A0A9K3NYM7_HELAN|nr:hypothetical protein HanXRQr2_Chr02g0046441 [Helianthus annuus]
MLSLSQAISRSRVSITLNHSFSLNPTEDPVGLTSRSTGFFSNRHKIHCG